MFGDEESIFGDDEPATTAAPSPAPETPKAEVAPAPPAPQPETPAAPAPAETPAVATDAPSKAKILAEKIFKKGHIVDLHIGGMTFKKKLQPKDIGKKKEDVPEQIIALGHKRLLKKEDVAEIQSIRNKAYALVEQYSNESWIPKLRYMTKENATYVVGELMKIRQEFFKAVEKFVVRYPELRESMLKEFPEWKEALEPFYPPQAKVKDTFYFEVNQYTISMVTPEGEFLSGAQMEIEKEMMGKLHQFLKDTVKNTRQLFLEELTAVQEKLNSGDKVNAKTIKKIQEMIDEAKTKDIAGDAEFMAMLDTFKKKFTVDAAKEKNFKAEVEGTLNQILTAGADEKAVEETVSKYKRSILID